MNFKVKAIKRLKLEKDEILVVKFGDDIDHSQIDAFRKSFKTKFPQFADKTIMLAGDVELSKVSYKDAVASTAPDEEPLKKSDAAPNDAGITQS